MKAAVVGYGKVGIAIFSELLHARSVDELVLVGRNRTRIRGEINDYEDALALHPENRTMISGGGYDQLADADVIIYTVGPEVEMPVKSREAYLRETILIARDVADQLNRYNREALIIVASNPVDIATKALVKYTGRPRERVIGTGTLLDCARLDRQIAKLMDIDPSDVASCVLGEHGESSLVAWSWFRLLGMNLDELFSAEMGADFALVREKVLGFNREADWRIFAAKANTCYGAAAAAAKLVFATMHDTHEVMPVSVLLRGEYGIEDVALSVPCRISRAGAEVIPYGKLSDDELAALQASAESLRKTMDGAL